MAKKPKNEAPQNAAPPAIPSPIEQANFDDEALTKLLQDGPVDRPAPDQSFVEEPPEGANEPITIVEEPPEGDPSVDKTFAMVDPTDPRLADFAPPPPIEAPPPPLTEVTQGIRSEPPVVAVPEKPKPEGVDWSKLPAKVRQELEAGRAATGVKHVPLEEAIKNGDVEAPAPPPKDVPSGADERGPREADLPLRIQAELKAGRAALNRRDADYRAAVEKARHADADKLATGVPSVGDLDYKG